MTQHSWIYVWRIFTPAYALWCMIWGICWSYGTVRQFCKRGIPNLTREKNLGATSVCQGRSTTGIWGGMIWAALDSTSHFWAPNILGLLNADSCSPVIGTIRSPRNFPKREGRAPGDGRQEGWTLEKSGVCRKPLPCAVHKGEGRPRLALHSQTLTSASFCSVFDQQ